MKGVPLGERPFLPGRPEVRRDEEEKGGMVWSVIGEEEGEKVGELELEGRRSRTHDGPVELESFEEALPFLSVVRFES